MLVGTVQYMSPEQALGRKLDGRTDLWSLGILLYEMVCGKVPFKASTHAEVFDEILHKEPIPPSEINFGTPEELEQIILKLLEKDADMRYQTATDLLADLKRLRRNLGESFESSEMIGFSSSSGFRKNQVISTKRNSLQIAAYTTLIIAVLSGVVFAIYNMLPATNANFSFENAKPTRVTNLGNLRDATVSNDGKYIAYVLDEGEKQSLWLKQTGNGGISQIVSAEDIIFQGIEISPDRNWVYYDIWDKKSVGEIFRVPILGGKPEKVIHDCVPNITISPDSKTIVFIRSVNETGTAQLISVDIETKKETIIYESEPRKGGIYSASFAPDGKTLAVIGNFPNEKGDYIQKAQIAEISADGSERKTIWVSEEENTGFASNPQWLPDKSGLLASLNNGEIGNKLWKINYPDGTQTPIDTDLNSYDSLSITADGQSFVGVEREFTLSVWTFPLNDLSKIKRLTEGKTEGTGLDWTPDGKIIYSSNVNGSFNLWIMNADGTEKKQVTNDNQSNTSPCVTLDGENILFFSRISGVRVVDFEGKERDLHEWKEDVIGNGFNCLRSENGLIYYSGRDKKDTGISKINIDTKEVKLLLSKKNIQQMFLSPNGKRLFFSSWNNEKKRIDTKVLDLETKKEKDISLPASAINSIGMYSHYNFNWTKDSKSLAFIDERNGVSNIWIYEIDTGKTERVTNFQDNRIFDFSISHDGKQIAVSRGSTVSDVVLFKSNN